MSGHHVATSMVEMALPGSRSVEEVLDEVRRPLAQLPASIYALDQLIKRLVPRP
jgi:hypothetical protein